MEQSFEPLPDQGLSFLWLELTSLCNLKCVHCYAESGPSLDSTDVLNAENYQRLISSAASLGCRRLQFIGGEPTLHPALPELIAHARKNQFDLVEVYTNATRISDQLLSCFIDHDVSVATSFYSYSPGTHDAITNRPGSHAATVRTLQRVVGSGLNTRVGIIVMDSNAEHISETKKFLHEIGVEDIGTDRVRGLGRGAALVPDSPTPLLKELCGSCWKGSVCIGPNGIVSPCIMAKAWSVGSLLDATLEAIVASDVLHDVRERIYNEVWLRAMPVTSCIPSECSPVCNPTCSPNCSPCYPHGRCNPELFCGPCGPGR